MIAQLLMFLKPGQCQTLGREPDSECNPRIDKYIRTLEVGLSLNEEEQLRLAQGVTEFLEKAPA